MRQFLEVRHETRTRSLAAPQDSDQPTTGRAGAPVLRELIAAERQALHRQLRDGKITDETRRRIERDLDLEEAVINNRQNSLLE